MMSPTLLFDVDGVLVHSRFHPDTARRPFWDAHLLTDMGIEPGKFQDRFGPQFEAVITGRVSLVDLLDRFLPAVGYIGSTLSFVTYWLERDCEINYRLIDAIVALRRSTEVSVMLATNQEHLRASFLWRHFRLENVFDDMLYAARLGEMKPNRGFYEAVANHLPHNSAPVILFDDSAACVEGADQFGWQGVLFNDLDDFTGHAWVSRHMN